MTMPPEPPPSEERAHLDRPHSPETAGRFIAAPPPEKPEEPDERDEPGTDGRAARSTRRRSAAGARKGGSPLQRWAGVVADAGLLLAAIEVVQVAGSVIEGFTVPSSGSQGLAGDVWHRVGFAFLTNVSVANALLLVVAAVMASAPAVAARASGDAGDGRGRLAAELTVILTAIAAGVLAIGSVLAVRTRFHQFDLVHQPVPTYQRWSLFTFVAGSVGGCLIAFVIALSVPRAPTARAASPSAAAAPGPDEPGPGGDRNP